MPLPSGKGVLAHHLDGAEIVLILSRNIGMSLMVGDEIVVTVLGISGERVRLGVQAPRDVTVHREEVYARIHSPTLPRKGLLQAPAPQVRTRRRRPLGSIGE